MDIQRQDVRVLLAWPNLLPTNHAGAVRGFAAAAAVVRRGGAPILVTACTNSSAISGKARADVLVLRLYDTYAERFPPPLPALLLPFTVLRLRATAARHHSNLVISSTPGLFLALESLLVAKLLGVPFVLDVRDAWQLEEVTHAGSLRNRVKRRLEASLCRGAGKVWTVTESLAQLLIITHRLPRGSVMTVPNGADLSRFLPSGTPKTYDLAFLGVPSRYRNVPTLLMGFEALAARRANLRIVWIGWRATSLVGTDGRRMRSLIDSGVLELVPAVEHAQVPSFLGRTRIGVVSLSTEDVFRSAIGAKTYEYLASGLPVVCLGPDGQSELRRLVELENVGLYATNPSQFADNADRILSDESLWKQLSENALKTARMYDRRVIFDEALRATVSELVTAKSSS